MKVGKKSTKRSEADAIGNAPVVALVAAPFAVAGDTSDGNDERVKSQAGKAALVSRPPRQLGYRVELADPPSSLARPYNGNQPNVSVRHAGRGLAVVKLRRGVKCAPFDTGFVNEFGDVGY
jgi:hypothetical protein